MEPISTRELACSLLPGQAQEQCGILKDSSRPSEDWVPEVSLSRFWGNWVEMEGRRLKMKTEAPPVGGAQRSCPRNRTLE